MNRSMGQCPWKLLASIWWQSPSPASGFRAVAISENLLGISPKESHSLQGSTRSVLALSAIRIPSMYLLKLPINTHKNIQKYYISAHRNPLCKREVCLPWRGNTSVSIIQITCERPCSTFSLLHERWGRSKWLNSTDFNWSTVYVTSLGPIQY